METISIEFTREELTYRNISFFGKIEKALEQLDAPQIGDRCAFWDDDKSDYSIGTLGITLVNTSKKHECKKSDTLAISWWFKHCAKIKKEAEF